MNGGRFKMMGWLTNLRGRDEYLVYASWFHRNSIRFDNSERVLIDGEEYP